MKIFLAFFFLQGALAANEWIFTNIPNPDAKLESVEPNNIYTNKFDLKIKQDDGKVIEIKNVELSQKDHKGADEKVAKCNSYSDDLNHMFFYKLENGDKVKYHEGADEKVAKYNSYSDDLNHIFFYKLENGDKVKFFFPRLALLSTYSDNDLCCKIFNVALFNYNTTVFQSKLKGQ